MSDLKISPAKRFASRGVHINKWASDRGFHYGTVLNVINQIGKIGPMGSRTHQIALAVSKYLEDSNIDVTFGTRPLRD